MSALTAIVAQLDRLAKGREVMAAAFASGDDFWTKVDAAADETYENAVKGSYVTAIDAELATGGRWSTTALRRFGTLHEAYFADDLSLALPTGGGPRLETYLAANGGFRVPYWAAEAYYEATGLRLPAYRVSAKGTLPADEATPVGGGMHTFGVYAGAALTGSDGDLPSTGGPVPILAVNMSASQTVSGTFTLTNWVAATTKSIALSLSSAAQYSQTVLGEEAVTSEAAAGQKVVAMAATGAFTVGEYVLIWESDALQQVAKVASIQSNTSLTMVADLLNTFSTSAVVWPLFRSVAYASGAGGSGNVNFYARPDRIIAL